MGELAALATAVCWAFSSVFFTAASKQIGALAVNRVRLIFAVLFLLVTHTALTGALLPLNAEPYRWLWLGLSGIVGLVIGDTLLFKCYTLIGNRLGTLIMAGAPVLSTLLALLFLGEHPSLAGILGMLLCVSGIAVVVLERGGNGAAAADPRSFAIGLLYGLGGAAGQAVGLVLSKAGLGGGFPAISGVMIRMLVALLVIWSLTLLARQGGATLRALGKERSVPLNLLGGSLVGPFIGVWLSQIAVQQTYVGVASTLMAITPIVLLPIARWYYKEAVSTRAVLGTLLALAGVAVIFL